MLCSVDEFKVRYGFAGDADDDAIEAVLVGVSALLAKACGRSWAGQAVLEEAVRTMRFTVDVRASSVLWLPTWPVAEVEEVLERYALTEAWEDCTPLVEGTDFEVDQALGSLLRVGVWPHGNLTVQVRYRAGYVCETLDTWAAWEAEEDYTAADRVLADGRYWRCLVDHTAGEEFETTALVAPGEGEDPVETTVWAEEFPVPEDLREACLQQAGLVWQRRGSLGLSGGSAGSGGSASWETGDDLLPAVKEVCGRYRRLA